MGQKSSVVYDAKELPVAITYESELPYQRPKFNFVCKPKAYPRTSHLQTLENVLNVPDLCLLQVVLILGYGMQTSQQANKQHVSRTTKNVTISELNFLQC